MLLHITIYAFTLIAEHGRCYEDPERGQVSMAERREALERGPRRRAASIFLIGLAALLLAITCALIVMGTRQSLTTNRRLSTRDLILFFVPAMLAAGVMTSLCLECLFMKHGVLDRILPINRRWSGRKSYATNGTGLPPGSHLPAGPGILSLPDNAFD